VATTTNAMPYVLLDLAMSTCLCRSKWCTSNDESVLQDNILPRIMRVATKIMPQHQEVVATYTITTPKVWLLQGASFIASHNECGNMTYMATPSGGNMCNCHIHGVVAIQCNVYCHTDCLLL